MKLELALLAHFYRVDGLRLVAIARRMNLSVAQAHHLSRVGHGYLRRLSHLPYLRFALESIGKTITE